MKDLLFGFHGRANRAKFWLVALGIFVLEVIIFAEQQILHRCLPLP